LQLGTFISVCALVGYTVESNRAYQTFPDAKHPATKPDPESGFFVAVSDRSLEKRCDR
jgi:hypothetical protein